MDCLSYKLGAMSATLVFTLYLTICFSASVVLAKTCPPFPYMSLKHGTIIRLGYQKYTFECDKGYFINEQTTFSCKQGKWTPDRKPSCYKIRGLCDEPPHVEHGRVIGDERHVGSMVTYMCDEGYILLGHSYLSCLKNQHWDRIPPTCMDENEPLETVAERLKDTFVTEIGSHSADTEWGRSLSAESVALGLELFLLIDRSSSVDPVHLEKAKNFVKFLLKTFVVKNQDDNENGTRAEVIAFGTDIQTVFEIDDTKITDFEAAAIEVDKIEPNGGGTNMQGALSLVMVEAVKLRKDAKRALFLMTDGEPNIGSPDITPQDIASSLKTKYNFEIFTVGIGGGVNTFLLNELASEPPLSHVFVLKDYPDLDVIMKIIQARKLPPPPVSKDQCGYNAKGEDRPWLATLYVGGGPLKLCGGVLICSQWVITAATCLQEKGEAVDMKDVFVMLGERHLLKTEKRETNFYVTDIRIHPKYDPNSIQNDLALLKLDLPTSKYRPACLPPTDTLMPLHLERKINVSVAGWGRTSSSGATYARASDVAFQMASTPVTISGEGECPLQRPGMTMLCAGQGSRSCYSLLGSPLIATDPTKGYNYVLGVQIDREHCSWGKNQYLELTEFVGWINQETANCQLKHWGLAE